MLTVLITAVVVSAAWAVVYKVGVEKVKAKVIASFNDVENKIKERL